MKTQQQLLQNQHSTAILVFARSGEAEANHTIFVGNSPQDNRTVSEELLRQTLNTSQNSGLPVRFFSEEKQFGQNFGERFSNAIQAVFDEGFEKVIAIGSDTPALQTIDIQKAANQLSEKDWVVGPGWDGGIYLIGMRRAAFSESDFRNIEWETQRVQSDLAQLAASRDFSFSKLKSYSDFDSEKDVFQILKEIAADSVLFQLLAVGFSLQNSSFFYKEIYSSFSDNECFKRGPPSTFLFSL